MRASGAVPPLRGFLFAIASVSTDDILLGSANVSETLNALTGAVRCNERCTVQLQVSETLNALTGAVRCDERCTAQQPVSETLNAPKGALNTVQAEGVVR